MKGPIRLGLLLTVIWLLSVIGVAANEFRTRNIFCQFNDPPGSVDTLCDHYFWFWASNPGDTRSFTPATDRMVVVGIGVPAVGWLLAVGILWVIRGFKQGNAT